MKRNDSLRTLSKRNSTIKWKRESERERKKTHFKRWTLLRYVSSCSAFRTDFLTPGTILITIGLGVVRPFTSTANITKWLHTSWPTRPSSAHRLFVLRVLSYVPTRPTYVEIMTAVANRPKVMSSVVACSPYARSCHDRLLVDPVQHTLARKRAVCAYYISCVLVGRQQGADHAHSQPERTCRLWQYAWSVDAQVCPKRLCIQHTVHWWVRTAIVQVIVRQCGPWCQCLWPNFFVPGETGLGKSTLMDSLFNTNFESTPSTHNLPNVKLKAHTYELQESNVQLKVINSIRILLEKYCVDIYSHTSCTIFYLIRNIGVPYHKLNIIWHYSFC